MVVKLKFINMGKKIRFTFNDSTSAQDKFVVMGLEGSKRSNTILLRLIRPGSAVTPTPVPETMIRIETAWENNISSIDSDDCCAMFVVQSSYSYIRMMLGLDGSGNMFDEHYLPHDWILNMNWGDTYLERENAIAWDGRTYNLKECAFYILIRLPDGTYRISDLLNGPGIVNGSTVHIIKPFVP